VNNTSWYEVISAPSLLQGDIVFGCPVPFFAGTWTFPLDPKDVAYQMMPMDLVVLTQSCDLENNKIDHVLVARVIAWHTTVLHETQDGNPAIKSRDFRRKLIDGAIPGLSLLHKHEGTPMLEWSVVNFHRLYTLPKSFLEQYAKSVGPRLRLRSPYREHLAQAFARYFMRVGLPHDAKGFEKEGDIAVTS
jgi:hypothetical protein